MMRGDQAAFLFLGTLAPFSRASESPMAIACLRLLTVPPLPPLPDLSVPFFLLCMALFTDLPAAAPYFRPLDFFFELERFLVAIVPPLISEKHRNGNELRIQKLPFVCQKAVINAKAELRETPSICTILSQEMFIFVNEDIQYKSLNNPQKERNHGAASRYTEKDIEARI